MGTENRSYDPEEGPKVGLDPGHWILVTGCWKAKNFSHRVTEEDEKIGNVTVTFFELL
jgi:hypothetical protein